MLEYTDDIVIHVSSKFMTTMTNAALNMVGNCYDGMDLSVNPPQSCHGCLYEKAPAGMLGAIAWCPKREVKMAVTGLASIPRMACLAITGVLPSTPGVALLS
ncbi:hypothetical protein J6590_071366 [Homalodisca vitripennis]|nr:hypothetical protein J6590_071366 [Homalodisca vitripennis]